MKTKEEILIEFGCPNVPFDENVTMYYPAILSAMEEYAQQQQLNIHAVSKSAFLDCNGDELKAGDKAIMTIKGFGVSQVEIVDHENQLQIFDTQMGYYPLIHALNRSDMVIELIS